MRILFIGGTSGFVGTRVIERLAAGGHHVTVFHRGETNTQLPEEVRIMHGDRQRLVEDHAAELRKTKPDVVVDNYLRFEKEATDLVNVFRGVAERIVAASSQDVYRNFGLLLGREKGQPNEIPITEDGLLRSVLYPYRDIVVGEDDPKYDYDKIPCEQTVMNDPGISGTVLRLPPMYGPGDKQNRFFRWIKRMDDGRDAIILEEREAEWRWTHGFVENVADAYTLAVTDARAKNRIYNLGEPETPTRKELIEMIGRVAGWKGRVITVSRDRLPDNLKTGFTFDVHLLTDTARIRRELGYKEKIPLNEALARTVEWERSNPPDENYPEKFNYESEDKAAAR